jgi:branched-subunit amino acid aminotransferase/4-amino-4-deoxychorismate lyase
LRLEDLYEADEVFISSTTRLLLPVDRILDRRIAKSGSDGWPVATRLREALRAYIREYVAKAQRQAVA